MHARLDTHGRAALALRRLKIAAHQTRRLAQWALDPRFAPAPYASADDYPILLGRATAPLERADPDSDPRLEVGKRRNLELAVSSFDGRIVEPGHILSFWRTLGRITAARGYVYGLELRGGCLVPALGGGVCLLSNTLFALAARLGWRIHERHGHSMEAVPPPAGTLWGLDATVFWPYVDLRVEPTHGPARLSARLEADQLVVEAHGATPMSSRYRLSLRDDQTIGEGHGRQRSATLWRQAHDAVSGAPIGRAEHIASSQRTLLHQAERRRSCLTCGETGCHARPDIIPLRLLEPGAARR